MNPEHLELLNEEKIRLENLIEVSSDEEIIKNKYIETLFNIVISLENKLWKNNFKKISKFDKTEKLLNKHVEELIKIKYLEDKGKLVQLKNDKTKDLLSNFYDEEYNVLKKLLKSNKNSKNLKDIEINKQKVSKIEEIFLYYFTNNEDFRKKLYFENKKDYDEYNVLKGLKKEKKLKEIYQKNLILFLDSEEYKNYSYAIKEKELLNKSVDKDFLKKSLKKELEQKKEEVKNLIINDENIQYKEIIKDFLNNESKFQIKEDRFKEKDLIEYNKKSSIKKEMYKLKLFKKVIRKENKKIYEAENENKEVFSNFITTLLEKDIVLSNIYTDENFIKNIHISKQLEKSSNYIEQEKLLIELEDNNIKLIADLLEKKYETFKNETKENYKTNNVINDIIFNLNKQNKLTDKLTDNVDTVFNVLKEKINIKDRFSVVEMIENNISKFNVLKEQELSKNKLEKYHKLDEVINNLNVEDLNSFSLKELIELEERTNQLKQKRNISNILSEEIENRINHIIKKPLFKEEILKEKINNSNNIKVNEKIKKLEEELGEITEESILEEKEKIKEELIDSVKNSKYQNIVYESFGLETKSIKNNNFQIVDTLYFLSEEEINKELQKYNAKTKDIVLKLLKYKKEKNNKKLENDSWEDYIKGIIEQLKSNELSTLEKKELLELNKGKLGVSYKIIKNHLYNISTKGEFEIKPLDYFAKKYQKEVSLLKEEELDGFKELYELFKKEKESKLTIADKDRLETLKYEGNNLKFLNFIRQEFFNSNKLLDIGLESNESILYNALKNNPNSFNSNTIEEQLEKVIEKEYPLDIIKNNVVNKKEENKKIKKIDSVNDSYNKIKKSVKSLTSLKPDKNDLLGNVSYLNSIYNPVSDKSQQLFNYTNSRVLSPFAKHLKLVGSYAFGYYMNNIFDVKNDKGSLVKNLINFSKDEYKMMDGIKNLKNQSDEKNKQISENRINDTVDTLNNIKNNVEKTNYNNLDNFVKILDNKSIKTIMIKDGIETNQKIENAKKQLKETLIEKTLYFTLIQSDRKTNNIMFQNIFQYLNLSKEEINYISLNGFKQKDNVLNSKVSFINKSLKKITSKNNLPELDFVGLCKNFTHTNNDIINKDNCVSNLNNLSYKSDVLDYKSFNNKNKKTILSYKDIVRVIKRKLKKGESLDNFYIQYIKDLNKSELENILFNEKYTKDTKSLFELIQNKDVLKSVIKYNYDLFSKERIEQSFNSMIDIGITKKLKYENILTEDNVMLEDIKKIIKKQDELKFHFTLKILEKNKDENLFIYLEKISGCKIFKNNKTNKEYSEKYEILENIKIKDNTSYNIVKFKSILKNIEEKDTNVVLLEIQNTILDIYENSSIEQYNNFMLKITEYFSNILSKENKNNPIYKFTFNILTEYFIKNNKGDSLNLLKEENINPILVEFLKNQKIESKQDERIKIIRNISFLSDNKLKKINNPYMISKIPNLPEIIDILSKKNIKQDELEKTLKNYNKEELNFIVENVFIFFIEEYGKGKFKMLNKINNVLKYKQIDNEYFKKYKSYLSKCSNIVKTSENKIEKLFLPENHQKDFEKEINKILTEMESKLTTDFKFSFEKKLYNKYKKRILTKILVENNKLLINSMKEKNIVILENLLKDDNLLPFIKNNNKKYKKRLKNRQKSYSDSI